MLIRYAMISPMLSRIPRLRGTLVILVVILAAGTIATFVLGRQGDAGPRPFDPDQHLRQLSELPGNGIGRPDLVSLAPTPQPAQTISFAGTEMLVVTFDGLIRNLGPGPLDIYGDPNASDGIDGIDSPHQRIWDGTTWIPVNRPPVRFESADGHNHFHFLRIDRYSLWDSTMSREIAPSNKVGFCLIDSIQDDPAAGRGYFSDDGNYCRQGSPGAEVLRMGISPGFSDIYTSDVALQWVDVSDIAPGAYRVAAEIDPFDRIDEADETNNGIKFANEPTIIPGHLARPTLLTATDDSEPVEIQLGYDTVGVTTNAAIRITSPPLHGTVEVGDPGSPTVAVYTPEPGFTGVDTFGFAAYDPSSSYPITPVESVAMISIGDVVEPEIAISGRRSVVHTGSELKFSAVSSEPGASPSVEWSVDGAVGGSVRSGTIDTSGIYRAPDQPKGSVEISADTGSAKATIEIDVVTPPNYEPFIQPPVDYVPLTDAAAVQQKFPVSTIALGQPASFIVSATDPNGDPLGFTATGLPPGLTIEPGSGYVSGVPTVVGEFSVTFGADDGVSISQIEVTITVE